MINPTAASIAIKGAATVATNKKTWTVVGSIVAGVIALLLIPFLLFVSIYSGGAQFNRDIATIVFEGGSIPKDFPPEYVEHMEFMIDAFELLTVQIEEINQEIESESLDDIRIKAFFYCLYLGQSKELDEDFYKEFVHSFVDKEVETDSETGEETIKYTAIQDMDRIYSNVEDLIGKALTSTDCTNIHNLYLFIKFGYTNSPVLPGYPGGGLGNGEGGGMGDISGIPPEALED